MKRNLTWLKVIVILALVISLTTVTFGAQDVIKLTFRTHFNEQGNTRGEIFKAALDQYLAKHKNIEVDYEAIDAASHKTKIQVEMAGGVTPDIFTFSLSAQDLERYVKAGKIADLTPFFRKDTAWKNSFAGGALNDPFVNINGKLVSVPFGGYAEVIFYNKAIFSKYKISVPKTLDDFKAAIKTLKANNVIPMSVGDKQPWVAPFFFHYLMDRYAGTQTVKDIVDGKGSFNNPDYVKATQTYNELVKMGAFNEGAAMTEESEGDAMFYTEKSAMLCSGTWAIGKFVGKDANPGFADKVGAFAFPTVVGGKGEQTAYCGGFERICISSELTGKRLAAAVDLLKYVAGPAYAGPVFMKNGELSAVKLPSKYTDAAPKPFVAVQKVLENAKGKFIPYDAMMPSSVVNAWTANVQEWLSGQSDTTTWSKLDEALKNYKTVNK